MTQTHAQTHGQRPTYSDRHLYIARNCTIVHQEASEMEAKERRGKREGGSEAVMIAGREGKKKRGGL